MTTITLAEPETGQQLTPREAFTVGFPDGMVVTAEHRGHLIRSDQPAAAGGGDSAPAPFDLFLASIATCAGLYALRFCQQRQIPTAGLAVRMVPFKDETSKRIALLDIELTVP
ncbi:MAG TPA: OsmC family protein, partial [Thermoanaerobaculia bacterium]|nr:OsmC family protein [Thermoanaerobaculia bacterium]